MNQQTSFSKRFYLTGHNNFDNRGCEGIVRSTVDLLREKFGDIEMLVPSSNIILDRIQWPEAEQNGVRFVPAYLPWYCLYWSRLQRLPIPLLKRAGWPFLLPEELKRTLAEVDAVLSIGGDNYSLNYGLPSMLMGINEAAMSIGTPVILWAASVVPFEPEPHFVPVIREHLKRMSIITARESITARYLTEHLGLDNVLSVADPVFTLKAQAVDVHSFWPKEDGVGVLGLNISRFMIERYRPPDKSAEDMIDEIAEFLRYAVHKKNLSVLLVPHVTPLKGTKNEGDAFYMRALLESTGDMNGRVRMMDSRLNAAETKYVIGGCRFFIGVRTHSTIAAFSSCIPTVSIAYSIKAKGINQDLFGSTDYVLETTVMSFETLCLAMERIMAHESKIKEHLRARMPIWNQRAASGAKKIAELLL